MVAANQLLRRFGYRAVRWPKALQVEEGREVRFSLLHEIGLLHLQRQPATRPFRFVQIGSLVLPGHYDLVEIARKFGDYRGVLIDAQPSVVEQLEAKYGSDPSVTILHRAITVSAGTATFYSVANDDKRFPKWVQGIASLDRRNITKFERELPGISASIVETPVQSTTLTDVIRQCGLADIDLVMIDAEGHDLEILKTLSLSVLQPRLIFLEHSHLATRDREEAVSLLLAHGYRVACLPCDLLASRDESHALR
jgi:FkbM family methyltransferase